MNALDSKLNVNRVMRASDAILASTAPHREHRRAIEEQRRQEAIAQARLAVEETEACKDDLVLDDVYPKVAAVISSKGEPFVRRGYAVVFRGTAHTLPETLKFTERGTRIIHRAFAMIPATALLLETDWAEAAKQDLIETARQEQERNIARRAEDAELIGNLRQEILHCIINKVTYIRTDNGEEKLLARSYMALYKHLIGILVDRTRVRGLRMTKLIHEAMIQQIQWAPSWEGHMARDMKRAEEREIEFIERNRKNKAERRASIKEAKHGNKNSVTTEENDGLDDELEVEQCPPPEGALSADHITEEERAMNNGDTNWLACAKSTPEEEANLNKCFDTVAAEKASETVGDDVTERVDEATPEINTEVAHDTDETSEAESVESATFEQVLEATERPVEE